MENIDITIENFGTVNQSNFDVAYTINGGVPVIENIPATLNAGTTMNYTFTVQGDFTALGSYDIIAYSSLAGDADNSNDTTYKTVEHSNCQPTGNCTYGDGVTLFQLGTINNPSGCSPNGYMDYTAQMTDLAIGQNHDLTVTSGWTTQYISVWIDYNDNFFFEANEMVVDGLQSNLGITTPITLAANAPIGEHLLRIKSGDNQGTTQDPCIDMTYGETEDYKVNLTSASTNTDDIGVIAITAPNSSFTLGNETITVTVQNFGTQSQSNFDVSYTLNGGTAVTENISTSLNSGQTTSYSFTTLADMTALIDFDILAYTSLAGDIDNLNDTILRTVTHFDDAGVSEESNDDAIKIVSIDGDLYTLKVNSDLLMNSTLKVHNTLGQLIFSTTVESETFTIDLSNFAKGAYLINVRNNTTSKLSKLVK